MKYLNNKTVQLQEELKNLPKERLESLHNILNKWISKTHDGNVKIMGRRMSKIFSWVESDVIEELVQRIYVWMYIHPDVVFDFAETDSLRKLFLTLAYHRNIIKTAEILINRQDHTEILDIYFEEEYEQYTNDALNPDLPTDERLKYHKIAMDELKEWMLDNPGSKLEQALKEMYKQRDKRGYDVALNFCATPSYFFLYSNRESLGLKNVNGNIVFFKQICAKIYGKEVKKNTIVPYKNI